MPKKTAIRRTLAALLIVLGGVLMFLAPETWTGLALLAIGVSLELIAVALRHRESP